MYVEDPIIISPLFLCISVKQWFNILSLRLLLYLLKFIRLYEHQQETRYPSSYFRHFQLKIVKNQPKKIIKVSKGAKTSILSTVTCNISIFHTGNNFL